MVRELVRRLKYYPLLQIISRVFYLIYVFQYNSVDYNPANLTDTARFAILLLYSIAVTICTVALLIVFLAMQPNAYQHLILRLTKGSRYIPPATKTNKGALIASIRNSMTQMSSGEFYNESTAEAMNGR